jgi:hypothetical protein
MAGDIFSRASALRRERRWAEARACYEQLLSLDLSPMDRAKMLANIAQMFEEEGATAEAVRTAEEVLQVVERYGLAESSEGIHLRGFMTGRLRRLRGEAVPWQLYIRILAPYIIGAAIGATIGAQIQINTLGFDAMPLLTDVRYGGACIGAVVGFFTLAPLAARYSGIALVGAVLSVIALGYFLFENSVGKGAVTLSVLASCFLLLVLRFSGPK